MAKKKRQRSVKVRANLAMVVVVGVVEMRERDGPNDKLRVK